MKIKAPLTSEAEVSPLCDAGADEFFCGVEPAEWAAEFGGLCVNQRAREENFRTFAGFERAVLCAHRRKTRVHVALNAFFYLPGQYEAALKIISRVFSLGADGVIISDPVLFSLLNRLDLRGKEIISGTDAVVFNSSAVDFYKSLGVTRIVLPRSLTLKEIEEITSLDKGVEYECFIIHDLCYFEDGLCGYCKEQSGVSIREGKPVKGVDLFVASRLPVKGPRGGCRNVFTKETFYPGGRMRTKKTVNFTFWGNKHIEGCGACAIYDLSRCGVSSLKVLDRSLPIGEKVKATSFIRSCAHLLRVKEGIRREDFNAICRGMFKKTFKVSCGREDCYYSWK
ncbi:MAG: U32 family peptidase [Candidatus Omnitrophota bacterium]|jgi:hypothetical protein